MSSMEPKVGSFPLPQIIDTPLGKRSRSAYNICLKFQNIATNEMDLIRVRVLGYMILYAPSPKARKYIVRKIHWSSRRDGEFYKLGEFFIIHFIHIFMQCETPIPTDPSSGSGFSTPEPIQTTSMKYQALIHDGRKCLVSGYYDIDTYMSVEQAKLEHFAATRCVYILPKKTYLILTDPSPKTEYSKAVVTVLSNFGYKFDYLNSGSLGNLMMMSPESLYLFKHFYLWFEAMEVENCYNIKTVMNYGKLMRWPNKTTFQSSDPKFTLPHKELLKLHAACAQVAYLSGAAEYLTKLHQDCEELGVLAHDGSASDILKHLLWKRVT